MKPYCSDTLREFHQQPRVATCVWVGQGNPRPGDCIQYQNRKWTFRKRLQASTRQFDHEELEPINTLSELDQTMFWKVVNSKKKCRNRKACEIKFNEVTVTSMDGILKV